MNGHGSTHMPVQHGAGRPKNRNGQRTEDLAVDRGVVRHSGNVSGSFHIVSVIADGSPGRSPAILELQKTLVVGFRPPETETPVPGGAAPPDRLPHDEIVGAQA